jgi:hypothetical protein
MIKALKAFGAFWYDFVVGDDWIVAAGVVLAFVCTALASTVTAAVWWIVPVAIVVLLPLSLWRETRPKNSDHERV